MAIVERNASRVAVMYLGQIVELGPRQSVFNQPQHPYTQRLLASCRWQIPRTVSLAVLMTAKSLRRCERWAKRSRNPLSAGCTATLGR
jgi:ABC-type dipeptide/oligopeptide/nickel transport system ATPase component